MSRLRNARLAKGLSQLELARRAKVSRGTVHNAETRAVILQSDSAAGLYHAVGLDLEDMLADFRDRIMEEVGTEIGRNT